MSQDSSIKKEKIWTIGWALLGLSSLFEHCHTSESGFEKDELSGIANLLKILSQEISAIENDGPKNHGDNWYHKNLIYAAFKYSSEISSKNSSSIVFNL